VALTAVWGLCGIVIGSRWVDLRRQRICNDGRPEDDGVILCSERWQVPEYRPPDAEPDEWAAHSAMMLAPG
jgi:hypothetical protein